MSIVGNFLHGSGGFFIPTKNCWRCRAPVGRGRVEMTNLIGTEVNDSAKWLEIPGTAVHLYGKKGAPPGRKMGHVTRVFPD